MRVLGKVKAWLVVLMVVWTVALTAVTLVELTDKHSADVDKVIFLRFLRFYNSKL